MEMRKEDFIEIKYPELGENEVFVSHVGDGEYSLNIFGSIHTRLTEIMEKIVNHEKCKLHEIKFFKPVVDEKYLMYYSEQVKKKQIYIANPTFIKRENRTIYWANVLLTVEKIDPEVFPYWDRGEY